MRPVDQCLIGDVRTILPTLDAGSVQCCVTSPPFWGLRDYGVEGQIGLEASPEAYVESLVGVFEEVRRVLRDDGTLWLNLGDTYCSNGGAGGTMGSKGGPGGRKRYQEPRPEATNPAAFARWRKSWGLLKNKDLVGIPWRVAFALQAAGWWLRTDIVWAKPNPLPESVLDRPTRSHEYLFLLTKSARYYYDRIAVMEPDSGNGSGNVSRQVADGDGRGRLPSHLGSSVPWEPGGGRALRDVWTITPRPYSGAHFAVFHPELIVKPILAGTSEAGCCAACGAPRERIFSKEATGRVRERTKSGTGGVHRRESHGLEAIGGSFQEGVRILTTGWRPTCDDGAPSVPCVVMDPFLGSGTTAKVAQDLGRRWIGVELNPAYVDLQTERAGQAGLPLLAAMEIP